MIYEEVAYSNIKIGDYVQLVILHGMITVSRIGKIKDLNRYILTLVPFGEKELAETYNTVISEVIEPLTQIVEIIVLKRIDNGETSKIEISKNKSGSKKPRKS